LVVRRQFLVIEKLRNFDARQSIAGYIALPIHGVAMISRPRLRTFLLLLLLGALTAPAQEIKQLLAPGTIRLDVVVTPKSGAPNCRFAGKRLHGIG
jgi:hypothetical protein